MDNFNWYVSINVFIIYFVVIIMLFILLIKNICWDWIVGDCEVFFYILRIVKYIEYCY